jgi:hypothetical protein
LIHSGSSIFAQIIYCGFPTGAIDGPENLVDNPYYKNRKNIPGVVENHPGYVLKKQRDDII